MDVVDASNLQRQILHNIERIGERKVDSAKKTLTAMNPDVNVVTYDVRLGADNVVGPVLGLRPRRRRDRQLPDPLPRERRLAPHARPRSCTARSSASRARSSVFDPYNGPCYRCLVPEPPPPELAPSCAEAGVLGVLCGIIGSLQAVEAMKLLLGIGEPLVGRLLAYDALAEEFRTFKVRRDPSARRAASDAGEIVIAEYDQLCMPHPKQAPLAS